MTFRGSRFAEDTKANASQAMQPARSGSPSLSSTTSPHIAAQHVAPTLDLRPARALQIQPAQAQLWAEDAQHRDLHLWRHRASSQRTTPPQRYPSTDPPASRARSSPSPTLS